MIFIIFNISNSLGGWTLNKVRVGRQDSFLHKTWAERTRNFERPFSETNTASLVWVHRKQVLWHRGSRALCNRDNCSVTKASLCTKAQGNTELKLLMVRFRHCQHSYTLQITNKVYMLHWFLLPKGELQGQTLFSPALTYFHFFLMHLSSTATTWPLRATTAYASDSRPHSHLDSIPSSAFKSLKKVRLLPLSTWILNRYIRTCGKAEFLK